MVATFRRILCPGLIALLLGFFSSISAADKIAPINVEELTKRSDLIVKAKVISWILTLDDGVVKGGEFPTRLAKAVLEVKEYEKGKGARVLELRFPQTDPARGPAPDGTILKPPDIEIATGRVYRFYLKKAPGEKWCVPVLDGEKDDTRAVQELIR